MGDDGVLKEVMVGLRTLLPRELMAIEAALAASDLSTVGAAAHRFCGMISPFSTSASAEVEKLEQAADHGRMDEALAAMARLKPLLLRLTGELEGLTVAVLEARIAREP